MSQPQPATGASPAPRKQTPAEQMAEIRRMKRAEYYSNQTPDEAKKKALDYQEKRAIERELHQESRKFELETELASRQISSEEKKKDAEHVHRIRLGAELDKKAREEEEKERQEKLARIRAQKEIDQIKKEEERLAKIAAFKASGGVRPPAAESTDPK